MDWLQQLLDNSTVPLITAFLLGLLTAVSPCPLATNITAIGYIGKDLDSRHRVFWNGILYTVGRVITYVGIGFILIPILREGASIYAVQKSIGKYGEVAIAPALIIIGLFMLFGNKLNLPKLGVGSSGERFSNRGSVGALLLGILFSLTFCPASGVVYFGVLMPMAAAEAGGYLLLLAFAIATGLPVIIVAWVLAYSVAGIGKFYHRMQAIQKWMNLIIALLFIIVGIYYIIILWL